ncbi:unnamed protein product, partial [Oppiella nova]
MFFKLFFTTVLLAYSLALEDDKYDTDIEKSRKPEHVIHPLMADRSSQREFTGEQIPEKELQSLFEASRWAPSSKNIQPWRFVYALPNTTRFNEFAGLLEPANQVWANKSAALVVQIAPLFEEYKGKVYPIVPFKAMFDSGSAYLSLALEAAGRGLSAVALGGIDYDRVYKVVNVTQKSHQIPIMIAIGKNPDNKDRKTAKTITPRNTENKWLFRDTFVNTDPDGQDLEFQ